MYFKKVEAVRHLTTATLVTAEVHWVSGFFATLPFRPMAFSPSGSFTPWLIHPLACLPPSFFACLAFLPFG